MNYYLYFSHYFSYFVKRHVRTICRSLNFPQILRELLLDRVKGFIINFLALLGRE